MAQMLLVGHMNWKLGTGYLSHYQKTTPNKLHLFKLLIEMNSQLKALKYLWHLKLVIRAIIQSICHDSS